MKLKCIALLFSLLSVGTTSAIANTPNTDSFIVNEQDGTVNTVFQGGRAPFAIMELARVVYFSTMTFSRDTAIAKRGDRVTVLSTVSCVRKQIKRVLVEKTDVARGETKKVYQSEEGAFRHMLSVPFRSLSPSEEQEARVMCATYLHKSGKTV